jgi:hypothetical protein
MGTYYHGTSFKNGQKIKSVGKLYKGSWVTDKRELARRQGEQQAKQHNDNQYYVFEIVCREKELLATRKSFNFMKMEKDQNFRDYTLFSRMQLPSYRSRLEQLHKEFIEVK